MHPDLERELTHTLLIELLAYVSLALLGFDWH